MPPTSTSHDRPYIEPERHDGLSDGVPANVQADAGQERRTNGTIALGASKIPGAGGKARKGRTRLTHDVQALPVPETTRKQAKFMRRRTCGELARTVGAGECGLIASSMVKLASEDMALRETALEAGQIDMARKLGESARMHLLYAREVCAKDAKARLPDARALPSWFEPAPVDQDDDDPRGEGDGRE